MIVGIPRKDGDDETFLTSIDSLISMIVNELEPHNLYVTRINKWFDHKWLRYSGRGRVKFEGDDTIDTALDGVWREKLTFPPFNPKQVGQQLCWERQPDGQYQGPPEPRWIHKMRLDYSSSNMNNRVASFSESGLFIWFTSHTSTNEHGSILVYSIEGDVAITWYASFKKGEHWVLDKTKGINRDTVLSWFPLG